MYHSLFSPFTLLYISLLEEAFPKTMQADTFLERYTLTLLVTPDSEAIPVAELRRASQWIGAFTGQEDKAILDIIRLDLMEEEQFKDEFPQFLGRWYVIHKRYTYLVQFLILVGMLSLVIFVMKFNGPMMLYGHNAKRMTGTIRSGLLNM